jgi:small subunit ribosomal protein S19
MSRSLKKGPWIDEKLLDKIEKTTDQKKPILTWSRSSTISPEMVGYIFGVHNGKEHISVKISEEMVGHKLGEFSKTRKFIKHGGRMAREEEITDRRTVAPGQEVEAKETGAKEEKTTEKK